ncbi:uncharacterized protein LOC133690311 isoform X5 [Populus nigra]|uniref:uncharacterized protein LOC133690311 isoform X5 n=1 Tax=Populus nigra TaxID=3691 RepID=UPI002B2693B3|nr:uncharacterized protein LOC133690311 isoform X5 [Populus nigra]
MEEEKKKKRNKKKKSKQNNHTNNNKASEDDVSVGAATNNNSNGQNQVIEVSSNGDVVDAEDFNGHDDKPNGAASHSPWLKREAALQETIKHLQNETDSLTRTKDTFEETIKRLRDENDSHIQKEHEGTYCILQATLEETVKQLQNESASHTQKEASLEDTINQLRSVNNLCIQKEATFEDTIKQLKTENDSHLQKEADLEKRIVQLQSEKDFWLQKEAGFGEKLNHLQDEKAALVLKAASIGEKIRLLESDKDSWTISENTTKETIARMNIDVTRLRMQVVELEDSRNSLVKENQQLKESISDLKLQLQNIDTSVSFANTSELGKVNELYIKLDHQETAASFSSATGRGVIVRNSELANGTHPMADSNANLTALGHKLESLEMEPAVVVQYSSEGGSGEIVQIPLDDNEVPDLEMQAAETDDKSGAVPLTDAPLIGAPFRLISFVAKYVSGGDLVNR